MWALDVIAFAVVLWCQGVSVVVGGLKTCHLGLFLCRALMKGSGSSVWG